MTRLPILTDSLIREALAPGGDVLPPHGLLAAIGDEIRATPQVRAPLRVPWSARLMSPLAAPAWSRRDPRLVMIIVAVALLLLLLGSALIGAGLIRPRPTPLVPTGLVSITPTEVLVDRVVVDGRGWTWAIASGQLTRFDPATGERDMWTAAEDAAFSSPLVAPAREGGLWVLADGRMRLFDGEGFRDTIPVAARNPMELALAPDGTPWLASYDLGLQRWDGRSWVAPPPGRPTDRVDVPLLVLGADDVWVENPGPGQRGEEGPMSLGVSHLTDGTWINYDADDAPQLDGSIGAIEQAADGSIWITKDASMEGSDPGIARFDGSTWTTVDGPPVPAWWLESGDDGSMWAITSAVDGGAGVARWADGTWRTFGPADGVTSSDLGHVSATPSGVYLGTVDGLLRHADGGWGSAWPANPDELVMPGGIAQLVGVSETEAWAADGSGLWHWVDGAWLGPSLPDGLDGATVADLAAGPGQTLWVATDRGAARWSAGAWTVLSARPATLVAVGPDGTGWAAIGETRLERIVPVADSADVHTVTCPLTPFTMSVASDGSVYVGDIGYSTATAGLARSDGLTCETVAIPGMDPQPAIIEVLPDARGGVVVEALETLPDHPGGGSWHGHVLRVDGDAVTQVADAGVVETSMRLRLVDAAGRVWRTPPGTGSGVEAWDGRVWTTLLPDVDVVGPLSMAPDGTVFFVGPGGVFRWTPDPPPGGQP